MKTKKFSMFDLPTQSPLDLYLVGYEVGTGENGENKSVRVLASNLVTECEGLSELMKEFNGEEVITTTNSPNQGECDSWNLGAEIIPHNKPITKIEVPTYNTNTTPLYLAAWSFSASKRTFLGKSDGAVTWTTNGKATWTFNNEPLIIPEGEKMEVFLAASSDAIGETSVTPPGIRIRTKYNNGNGSIRYEKLWYSDRVVECTLIIGGHKGDNTHLTSEQKQDLLELLSRKDEILALLG